MGHPSSLLSNVLSRPNARENAKAHSPNINTVQAAAIHHIFVRLNGIKIIKAMTTTKTIPHKAHACFLIAMAYSSLFFPHSGQNLVVMPFCPHEQSHVSGRLFPQLGQNLLVMPVFPQEHVHPSGSTGGVIGCAIDPTFCMTGWIASFVIPMTLPTAPKPTPNCIASSPT